MPAAPSILVTLSVFLLGMGLVAGIMRRRVGARTADSFQIAEKKSVSRNA
jgi:hypothetical protein